MTIFWPLLLSTLGGAIVKFKAVPLELPLVLHENHSEEEQQEYLLRAKLEVFS